MTKNTMKHSAQDLATIMVNCSINEQSDWARLGSAAACDNRIDVWERFLDDACHALAWAVDAQRDLARMEAN